MGNNRIGMVGRVAFWYEATKPQRYRHEGDKGLRTLQKALGLRNRP